MRMEDDEVDFCALMEARVEEQYDLQDGGSLCFSLLEIGVIDEDATVDEAAHIVALYILNKQCT